MDHQFEFMSGIIDRYDELKYGLLSAQTFDQEHFGFPPIYYKIMETDRVRVRCFQQAFQKYDGFKGAVVCEAGVGTLALTQHYLPEVKKAFLIENNPNLSDFIHSELQKNGWSDKVELIIGDAMQVQLPEKVDYIVGELMSIYCANEYQVQIFKHLRQFLKPEGKLIPEKIINLAQLGYAEFDEQHRHYPLFFTRHLPMLVSSQEQVNSIDLYTEQEENIKKDVPMRAILSGQANCVLMSSWVQTAEGINFTGTDSLMPPTVLKLEEEVFLQAGRVYELNVDFSYGTSLDQASFSVRMS